MKFNFIGVNAEILYAIDEIKQGLGFEISSDGMPVDVDEINEGITVEYNSSNARIGYSRKVEFFRALCLFTENITTKKALKISQKSFFNTNGAMFDCSRNAVFTVESVKKMIRYMALMGLDTIMLYTEDTYKVDSLPYFGYMRGAYTKKELIEIDKYAFLFGIEVIPCIQTLAHLKQALKWQCAKEISDTEDILLAGSEDTYNFIETLISHCADVFSSRKIHLGMDEAHMLGLGKYLKLNGYTDCHEIMNMHINRVMNIVKKYYFKPMIWSDMYINIYSENDNATDRNELKEQIGSDLTLVYWDYYHNQDEVYRRNILSHKKLSDKIAFAGGVWVWSGIAANYVKTFETTNAALSVCKEEGVKEVFATLWGDNGAETNMFYGLLGLQLFAEYGYNKTVDIQLLKARFKACTGYEFDSFYNISKFDIVIAENKNHKTEAPNISKCVLYQDVLKGLFDFDLYNLNIDLTEHYSKIEKEMSSYKGELFELLTQLARVLKNKWSIGIKLRKAYNDNNIEDLKSLINQLVNLNENIKELRRIHRAQWLAFYKPFGWEVLDIRYGGILNSIDTAIYRVNSYINGETEKLEELEAERLPFKAWYSHNDNSVIKCNAYGRIATACVLDW